MYATCLFCNGALGTNEAIERFPVGRRLAFDARRGRLWVVCRGCGRWNLTPLEERWEAIEECERAFRDTRVRVSTDHVGLARLRDGLELVRIGEPQRPEFAAWRYGDQFGRRRRDAIIRAGVVSAAAATIVLGGVVVGAIGGGTFWLAAMGKGMVERRLDRRRVAKLIIDGQPTIVRHDQLQGVRLALLHGSDVPTLQLGHGDGASARFRGADLERVLGQLLPVLNRAGGTAAQVQGAVREIEVTGAPHDYIANAARQAGRLGITALADYPHEVRLALEMAAHEEAERRALEGELATLERAWREAEELAAIADDLLVPAEVNARLAALKPGMRARDEEEER